MKSYTTFFLKIFLLSSILFGTMWIGSQLLIGEELKTWTTLFLSFFFGVIMASILTYNQKQQDNKNVPH